MAPLHRMSRAPRLGLGLLAITVACSGHGKHTSELGDESQKKMAHIRAAADYDLAMQQFGSGNLERALETVTRSIQSDAAVPHGHLLMGRILLEIGDGKRALAALETGRRLDETNPDFPYFEGAAFERLGELDRALERFRTAHEIDPTRPYYTLAVAEILIEQGDLDAAESLLSSGAVDSEYQPGFRQTLGHIAMMRGDAATAIDRFTEAAILSPSDVALREDLCRALILEQRFAEAETYLRAIARPERRDLEHLRASCLLELDRPVEARAILRELTRSDPNDVEGWIKMCDVAMILTDPGMLRSAADRVIAVAPNRHEGYLALAIWQRQAGQIDEARATVEKAIARAHADDTAPRRLLELIEQSRDT